MSPTLASTFICSTCVTVSLGSSGSAAAGSSPVGGADCWEGSMDAAAWGGVGGAAPPLGCALECCSGLRFRLRALCCGMCGVRVTALGCFGVVMMGRSGAILRCRETGEPNHSLSRPSH